MGAFDHIDIEHLMSIQNADVYCFLRLVRKSDSHGPADLAQGRMVGNAGAEPRQFGSDDICTCLVAEEIAFVFQVSNESVGSALVDAGLLGDFAELKARGRPVEGLQDAQYLANHADRGRFGLPAPNYWYLP